MQETIFYIAAGETLGSVRDFANAKTMPAPTLVRGVSALLRMRLFANREGVEPYLVEVLSGIVRWQWAVDTDFSEATAYKLQADNAAIEVASVTDEIDGDEYAYTEVSIPMPEMNTVEQWPSGSARRRAKTACTASWSATTPTGRRSSSSRSRTSRFGTASPRLVRRRPPPPTT